MPFDTPMTFGGRLAEISGFALLHFHLRVLGQLATGHYTDTMESVALAGELRKMTRNARVFLAIYAGIGVAAATAHRT
ncbi:MAG: hypothetical protein OXC25_02180 [Thiotrichales bacterium]|nr:hypothetical protein [Thiotrichales bacterium]MCY4286436.1 hypothetical protein [Thiotrichales bacterium]MCY4348642.1 hypothetical protein [Thiotrichales bacterium]